MTEKQIKEINKIVIEVLKDHAYAFFGSGMEQESIYKNIMAKIKGIKIMDIKQEGEDGQNI